MIYCFASAFGILSTSMEQIKFWTNLQYVGIAFSPPLGLLFITKYLGMKITKRGIFALLTVPFITLVMVATNDLHHLHYRVYQVDPILGAPFVHQEMGIWYIVHGTYIFACLFASQILVLSRWKETAKVYRRQLIALMCSQLVPMLTAFVYLLGITPPGIDPVPMMLWLSSLLYLWSISSSRMFTIMPIAKNAIFNSINDGVIVLNESHQLIEFNQACKNMFPQLHKSMFGMNFEQAWSKISCDAGNAFSFPLETTEHIKELRMTKDNVELIYQVRISMLQHENNNGFLLIFTDITELKKLQAKLEKQAFYDDLTQVYNRRAFFEESEQDFAVAKKVSSAYTVILIDIDYFKSVNDDYGHYVGDQMLVHVVKVFKSELTQGSLFARYGGEEFVVALKGHTLAEGEALANQLRKSIESQPLISTVGVISVTMSFGVAEANKETAETLHQLLNKADTALYTAKQAGRNQVHVYTGA